MGVDSTISGGSDRLARIQKMLREAPSSAVRLVLSADDGAEMGSWERIEWSDQLAAVVDGDMLDAHEEAGVSDSKFWLTLLDKEGRSKKRRSFDVRTRRELTADDMPLSVKLDGTAPASNALQQNVMFAHARLYMNGMQSLLNTCREILSLQNQMLRDTMTHERTARDDYHELRELLAVMKEEQASVVEPSELTPAQAEFYKVANKVVEQLPMLAAGLKMANGAKNGAG